MALTPSKRTASHTFTGELKYTGPRQDWRIDPPIIRDELLAFYVRGFWKKLDPDDPSDGDVYFMVRWPFIKSIRPITPSPFPAPEAPHSGGGAAAAPPTPVDPAVAAAATNASSSLDDDESALLPPHTHAGGGLMF